MERLFAQFATSAAKGAGSSAAFLLGFAAVIVWAISGPFFGYSETWQLVINTGTTIVTFLMVFLIQNTQNRDSVALQTKIDELIRSSNAEDEFMGIEKLSDEALDKLHRRCEYAARRSAEVLARANRVQEERRQRPPREENA